jgi:hypothetical protein
MKGKGRGMGAPVSPSVSIQRVAMCLPTRVQGRRTGFSGPPVPAKFSPPFPCGLYLATGEGGPGGMGAIPPGRAFYRAITGKKIRRGGGPSV